MSKAMKWYRRHRKAVGAVLDLACDAVPTAGVLKPFLNVVQAIDEDKEKEELKQKITELEGNQREFEKIVGAMMQVPGIRDIVEEVEESEQFSQHLSKAEVVQLIEQDKNLFEDLQSTVPKISGDLTASVQYFQNVNNQISYEKYNQAKKSQTKYTSPLASNKYLGGKYRLEERLGGGGQGQVYRAVNEVIGREVALKVLPPEIAMNKENIEALKYDYRNLTSNLSHRFIVQYRDLGYCDEHDRWFLVMDYIKGTTLRSTIIQQQGRPMAAQNIYSLLSPIAEALEYAHSKKISHNDIKPENILVSDDGRVMLTDFGLAEQIRNTISMVSGKTGDMTGTWPYMAPEQIQSRKTSGATDVWSLGVIIYEMAAGKHPFHGGTSFGDYQRMICEESIPKLYDTIIWNTVKKALIKDRKQRIQSPKQLLEDIVQNSSDIHHNEAKVTRASGTTSKLDDDDVKEILQDIGKESSTYTQPEFNKQQTTYKPEREPRSLTCTGCLGCMGFLAVMMLYDFVIYYGIDPTSAIKELYKDYRRGQQSNEQPASNTPKISSRRKKQLLEEDYINRQINRMDFTSPKYITRMQKKEKHPLDDKVRAEASRKASHLYNLAKEQEENFKEFGDGFYLNHALNYYRQSAKYGNNDALYEYSLLRLKGYKNNVPKSEKDAIKYLKLAASRGHKLSKKKLKELNIPFYSPE